MKLVSSTGSSFELRVIGYQFPNIENERCDSNWLIIEVSVVHPDGSWTARDPSLLTSEAMRLADWLIDVASGTNQKDYCSFIEPNLELRVANNGASLRVYFDLELRPGWAASDVAGNENLWVQFQLSEIDAAAAADELRQQLSAFPERAVTEE